MKFIKYIAAMVLAVAACGAARAQTFEWGLGFDYRFDNREYKDIANVAESRTLFGVRVTPQVGLGWGKGHTFMAGVDFTANFGEKSFAQDPTLLLYYNYRYKNFSVTAGALPRSKMIGEYASVFFSDSVRFFDPSIEGLLLQYVAPRGYVEIGADWNSMYSADRREKFMLFSAGRIQRGIVYAGYNLNMYHHAGTYTVKGVVDNILAYPYVGLDLGGGKLWFERFTLQAGFIQAWQNDRLYVGEYVRPHGAQIEARVEKWKVGIYNTLYLGDNLMPYWFPGDETPKRPEDGAPTRPGYGPDLYNGESFYTMGGKRIYNRLEIYWEPLRRKDMHLKIASVHHYNGRKWGWQQVITFSININKDMFKKRRPAAE